jgi:hypothetical protein
MSVTMQSSFLGKPMVSGNLRQKMAYVLQKYPEARNDYRLAMFYFWLEFEGLDDALGEKVDAFREWFVDRATSPKTLQNRTMEVQNRNPELDASPAVEEQRQRQSTAGPVL